MSFANIEARAAWYPASRSEILNRNRNYNWTRRMPSKRSDKFNALVSPTAANKAQNNYIKRRGSEWQNNTNRIIGYGDLNPYNGGPQMAGITSTSFPQNNGLYHSEKWHSKQDRIAREFFKKYNQNWSEGKLYPIKLNGTFNNSKHPYKGPLKTIPLGKTRRKVNSLLYGPNNTKMNTLKLPMGYDVKYIHNVPDYNIKLFDEVIPFDRRFVLYKKTRKNRKA